MNDHVARVYQHPVALRHALDADAGHPCPVQVFEHMIRDRADMAVRPAGGHDHEVADRGFATEIDGEGVLGLHIVEASEDEAKGLLSIRALGDEFGHTKAGPREHSR